MAKPERINILGVRFNYITPQEAVEKLVGFLDGDRQRTVFTPNPEFVMLARKDAEFMKILNSADVLLPDGVGIVLASRLTKHKLRERVTGCDTVMGIFDIVRHTGKTVYFYGSTPGVAELAKVKMEEAYPGLSIVGAGHGYLDDAGQKAMITEIKQLRPDIILVGLGTPRQERWISKHKAELPCKLLMGVGGSFDVMSGKVPRVPAFIGKMGFEWLYRLVKEPKRIKRQIKLPLFMFTAIGEKLHLIKRM